jgi:hypothetical protein
MTKAQGESREMRIIRGAVDSLTFYEVTEEELQILATGPSSSIFLNFGIALLSIAASFFVAIFTATLNLIPFVVFLVIAIITLIAGAVLMVLWWNARGSFGGIIAKIKARVESETVVDKTADPSAILAVEPAPASKAGTESTDQAQAA